MIGEPSIDMSITPPHCRNTRSRARLGHHGHAGGGDFLGHVKRAALTVAVVAVDAAAKHQPALVRLADVEMSRTVGDDDVKDRLDALGDEGLQHVGLDRQAQVHHRRQARGMAGDGQAHDVGGRYNRGWCPRR